MNFHKCFVLLAGLLTCVAGISSFGQPTNVPEAAPVPATPRRTELVGKLGDPAPPINTVGEWVKGRPVKIEPGTNIYVLVFCTLSRANEFALTNLSLLQKQYQDKGVSVVVISTEPPEQVRDFVQARGDEINYTVAADDDARRTTSNYQRIFRQMMLPRAYVVGTNGTVLWFGHPLRDNMGQVVDEIASGRYNLEQTKREMFASQQMEQYLALARQDDPRTPKLGRIMLTLRTNDAPALCDLAFQIATAPYIEKRDAALGNLALDRAEQLATTNALDIAVDRSLLLFQSGKEQEGLAKARQALTVAKTEDEKSEVNACIKAMEARLAEIKSSQTNSTSTNHPAGKP
jgi:hypothetical protein